MERDQSDHLRENPRDDGTALAARLQAHIASNEVIVFEEGVADKEFPYIVCSMWGVIPTNELFVRITNGDASFVGCVRSPLEVPVMADRIFGMDVGDANAAGALADQIWERHKHELIRRPSK